ncbi:hypothetical protein TRIUR3_34450 [Triticum urartu]|uniref:Uncharacterized protein n=1 Tax=Triticum urartu TaxID=4572 RepID=M8A852_TRIUA|nr:hypothetical protein TRIUR3_34450 [Triticum urartu]
MAEGKGATTKNPKMMPRQHNGSGHGDDRQQEAASGGRATTRRSCSGGYKWWTDAGSVKASGARWLAEESISRVGKEVEACAEQSSSEEE